MNGSSIVFDFNYQETIEATIPGNGEDSARARVADSVGCLTMKGQAIKDRIKEKDYYDIYTVTGFHRGDPHEAGKAFAQSIKEKGREQLQ
jgi:hypothetical protein